MKREQLEHILRAAGAITGTDTLIVIGSQAILASYPSAPEDLLVSVEADTYPPAEPTKADLIDGTIGEKSPFHDTFGYYAHGVGPETASLPRHWEERLVPICNDNTNHVTGLCLHPHDLLISKLLAGREKDMEFAKGMLRHHLVQEPAVRELLGELTAEQARLVEERLNRCLNEV